MRFVRRADWGAPATSAAAYIASTRGVKVHYLGAPYTSRAHSRCAAYVRTLRAAHLANPRENYSDIAYNLLVCEHGYVFEGRGAHRRTGANGNFTLNSNHYAVCALLGDEGLTKPTDAQLGGIRDAIEYLRDKGDAGDEILGHRDGYATACPGPDLYAWVKKGAPRPGRPTVSLTAVVYGATHRAADERKHPQYADDVARVQDALVARKRLAAGGFTRGIFDPQTKTAYAAEQRSQGYSGADADGVPGRTSLTSLGDGRFTVTT
ncbi:N-acetylmuramoyl-L-alanine amidase [Streptomyces sp. AC563]|uniref:N-acetylmuramoyl-L-alanine amidase n=1 Tax=Streptomyces buecherae TaxID=2763006 RepID=UPI00164E8DB2|nr:N-acetylmuramoyl-L-alanine amidase [Streptomyces buecherae]MBC3989324.1 N-acetylmuramoyl-L-alanine amidase [Streptomyces buecherae]